MTDHNSNIWVQVLRPERYGTDTYFFYGDDAQKSADALKRQLKLDKQKFYHSGWMRKA